MTSSTAAPTLFLAAMRRQDSDRRTQVEDRSTELLATILARHQEVGRALLGYFTGAAVESNVQVDAATQVHVSGTGRVDLVVLADDDAACWVEVKVRASESGDQLSNYQRHLATDATPGCLLATLDMTGDPSAWSVALDGGRHRTWRGVVGVLRSFAPHLPSTFDDADLWDLGELGPVVSDVAQFLVYLNMEGIVPMADKVTTGDLLAFDDWRSPVRRIWDLGAGARHDAFVRVFADSASWKLDTLNRGTARNRQGRVQMPRHDCEWWWGAIGYVSDDRWCVESTIASLPYWLEEADHSPGLVWGLTLRSRDLDLVEWADQIASRVGGLDVADAHNLPRRYGYIPFADVGHLDGPDQRIQLADRLTAHLDKLRQAISANPPPPRV